ncbi:enoyl-CoA-hydratase DpgD [Kitasatospora sp. NPDC049285]|uniref:enoyl-CoA-hydratase DpgD n=1 Tax=Kitasatospora sp. NPDC049285 TaxID=3157096 RepID=UPI003437E7DE
MDKVRYRREGHVAWVTLNRPEVLNAMDTGMHQELAAVWDEAEADDAVWLVVVTGAGDRAFSVGQDLKERARLTADGAPPTTFGSRGQPGWPRLTERFGFSKPLLARVQGYALGGGFELALACDLIVAAEDAVFALPEAQLGLVPGAGGAFRLARQLPVRTALGYLLTGRRIGAARAAELGLVNEVVPAERLDECVEQWVADLLRSAPLSVRAIKESVTRSLDLSLEQSFATRYHWEERRLAGEDAAEGPRAFVERRPPRWTGR